MPLRVLDKCRRPFVALLLSSLSALATAQGQGSWGGATGIVLAVIAVAAMGYLLAMWVVWRVVKAVGIKGALSVAVTVLISYAPIGYWMRESEHRNEKMEAQQQAYRNFRAQSEQYITEKCPTERMVSARVLLSAGAGVFLSDVKGSQLGFANIPPAAPLTAEMKRSYDKYGTRFPDETAVDGQFHQPLKWTVAMNPFGVLSQGPAFVEFVEQRGPAMEQKVRMARFRWWKENTSPAELEQVLKPYEADRSLERDNRYLTSPVDSLKSTYELEMRDVSTLEDREHWAARGRISLTRRSDKALVAEYVGLAASHFWEPTSGGWWERVTVCAGPETKYSDTVRWLPDQFFFGEVVRIEKTMSAK